MLEQMMKMLEGQQINSYRLNKFLGAGGFGGVFHASEMVRNTSLQEVAIKVIPESSDDKLNELQNARKLEHSNLIKAYSVGEFRFLNTEMLYLVMELAQGSLENHIAKGSLSSSEIKNITAQVAQGLNYLHGQNKVHRDLKPGNILKVNQQYK
nr:protein kinase [Microcystis aeruginosa L211-07]